METTVYEIHPAIGIARLGSSTLATEDGYFLGPEPGVEPPTRYRDPAGYLKRQAARFRLFACRRDEGGALIEATELTTDAVWRLTWTVHLANRKGVAVRIEGRGYRNRLSGDEVADRGLVIDPGPRTVDAPGRREVFDTGKFRTTAVKLGEIAMEPGGRLVVLGGHGRSGSDSPQARLTRRTGSWVDNANWYDDTSDGPVTATVELPDGTIASATAWVIVGPPDFAPGVANLISLYDFLYDRGVSRGILPAPTEPPGRVSFTRHVRPILERGMGYRWVNRFACFGYEGRGRGHGPGGEADYSTRWECLADPTDRARELRASIVGLLRNPDPAGTQPRVPPLGLVPRLNGVSYVRGDPGNVLPLTPTQYRFMQAWADGDFDSDLGRPPLLDEGLPDALDRMALDACVGGALYPGVEASDSILGDAAKFQTREAFRLSHDLVRPGEVTQRNSLPWQADFLHCRWEELTGLGQTKRLGWWPAQRPDDVFTEVGGTSMQPWARGIGDDYQDMVDRWDRLGVVADRGSAEAPFFVETERDVDALDRSW